MSVDMGPGSQRPVGIGEQAAYQHMVTCAHCRWGRKESCPAYRALERDFARAASNDAVPLPVDPEGEVTRRIPREPMRELFERRPARPTAAELDAELAQHAEAGR